MTFNFLQAAQAQAPAAQNAQAAPAAQLLLQQHKHLVLNLNSLNSLKAA